MTKEIMLWSVLGLVVLVVLTLAWASHSANAKIKDYIADEGLLGPLPPRPRPPMPEADLKCRQQARLYSAIKNSKRIQITRTWRSDPEHAEVIVGEPLAFGVDHNGCGWVTIKKDDGHVTHIMHFIADGVNSFGMEIVEVKFI